MLNTLYEVMLHVRKQIENCWVDVATSREDEFEIVGGMIDLPFLVDGQYFIISGSYFNDGLYQYIEGSTMELLDEKSRFYIISIKPPQQFIRLVEEIEEWNQKYSSKTTNPFSSESFDGYSYQKATGENGLAITWKDAFKTRLDAWRML